MFDQVFWRATSGQINRWRRNVLHLASTSLDKMEPHKIPFLYNFSPTLVPPPLDWPEWIRVTGTYSHSRIYFFLIYHDLQAIGFLMMPKLARRSGRHLQISKILSTLRTKLARRWYT